MDRAMSFGKLACLTLALGCLLIIFASRADAQIANIAMAELYVGIMDACEGWLVKAGEIALQLLAITAVIGFAIGMKDLVLAGNLTMDGIIALFVRYAFIVGILVWLLNAPQRLAAIPASIKKIGATISGQDISFGGLIDLFSEVVNPLVEFTKGLGWTDIGLIICMTFIIFLINCLFFMIASTVLVVEIEAVFILIGGLFTASFFVIGYFRDSFLSYIKALAAVGVKMLMLCLCLGIMRNIMSGWPGMISAQLDDAESIFTFLMPMSCALLGFYMLLKAVPQFASSVMSGGISGMDGGMLRAAAAAGYALGMTVVNTSRTMAQGVTGVGSTVSQAAQAYSHTTQAAKDTGSTPGEARAAGAWEAFKTVMTGPRAGGGRAAGDEMYSDYQRGTQFSDARGAANTDSLSAPVSAAAQPASGSPASSRKTSDSPDNSDSQDSQDSQYAPDSGRTSSAGPYAYPSPGSSGFEPAINEGRVTAMNQASQAGRQSGQKTAGAADALDIYGPSGTDSWGSYASDVKKDRGERNNEG